MAKNTQIDFFCNKLFSCVYIRAVQNKVRFSLNILYFRNGFYQNTFPGRNAYTPQVVRKRRQLDANNQTQTISMKQLDSNNQYQTNRLKQLVSNNQTQTISIKPLVSNNQTRTIRIKQLDSNNSNQTIRLKSQTFRFKHLY